jgi:hypothetical protein
VALPATGDDRVVAVGQQRSHSNQAERIMDFERNKNCSQRGMHPERQQKRSAVDLGKKKSKTGGYPMSVCSWTLQKASFGRRELGCARRLHTGEKRSKIDEVRDSYRDTVRKDLSWK